MEMTQLIVIKLERQSESENKSEIEILEVSCGIGEITKEECVQ